MDDEAHDPGRSNRPTLDLRAEECYEAFCEGTGDIASMDWARLSVAEREVWRRVVEVAWGQRQSAREQNNDGRDR